MPDADIPSHAYRIDRLRLRHLHLLEVIRRTGSLGSAARELGISQPAVTMLLRELEAVFDTVLVERSARGGRLTTAGVLALERLTIALASVRSAIDAARSAAIEPVLRLGCIPVAGVGILPRALARLESADLLGRIVIVEKPARELLSELCEGKIDCVIGWMDEVLTGMVRIDQLVIDPLQYGRMQVAAAVDHPLTKIQSVSVAEIARWRWVVPRTGSRTYEAFTRLFVRHGIPAPVPAVESWSLHTSLRLVGATRLLTVAPDDAVKYYAKLGTLARLKGPELTLERNRVSLVCRRENQALPIVKRLRQALFDPAGL
ncbi:LysR substrate-binding domain-containing protein [Pigmentiphaga soli]|uniref:LysR substrate-binding domain-containing protein n=1 Tax=Pigmentiphaga soli TaxID=1007095 RepID=A0ABP8GGE3_9BURK